MAFASLDSDDNEPLAEINMIPLIDVMLVLLVIFLVTAPLLTHAVKVDLPKAASNPSATRSDPIQLTVDATGQRAWNGAAVDDAALAQHLATAAAQSPQPEIHLRADRQTPYERVAQTLSAAAGAGLSRIGFVTDPSPP